MSNLPPEPTADAEDVAMRAAAGWFLTAQQRTLWMVPLAFPLAALAIILAFRGTNEEAAANFERSRQEMLAASPPEVPDEENAALDYRAAGKVYAPGPWNPTDPAPSRFRPLSTAEEVASFLTANAVALAHVRKGARKSACNGGLDWIGLKAMPDFITGPQLLNIFARERARQGDHAGAVEALRDCYAIARQAESYTWAWWQRAASDADDAIMEIVFWDPPGTSAEVMQYRNVVWKERDARQRTLKHLQAAKAHILYKLDGFACGAIPTSAFAWQDAVLLPRPGNARMLLYASERQKFCRLIDDAMDCARNGQWERLDELGKQFRRGPAVFIQPETVLIFRIEEENARILDTGLAFLQFRLKRGRDPVKLSELVPEFLPSLPASVFNGLPPRLRSEPIQDNARFTAKEFKLKYGDLDAVRIAFPDSSELTLPPLWHSKAEESVPAKARERSP